MASLVCVRQAPHNEFSFSSMLGEPERGGLTISHRPPEKLQR